MKVAEENLEQATVVSITGRLDVTTSLAFDERFVAGTIAGKNVVVDCSGLDFLSSAGLRVLLRLHKKLVADGGILVLCAPPPHVKEVLELSGMAAILKVHETREQALQGLG